MFFFPRTLYQIDRTACIGEDEDGEPKEVSIKERLEWITAAQVKADATLSFQYFFQ